ncbi:hypothetical protein TELCIR_11417 [Teladorsagia circumcincta]|uniref:Uncharacterized protein n=1 Tax=Teladorsagia circumcincta TaxID=45464 RepID=A0A2G9U9G6_TELCI|nr:hypothetical protein TELCIR_11417 [Teladorsagia circumcincta]
MTHSLPPSEPLDAGSSLSHTPDSEQEMFNHTKAHNDANTLVPSLRHMAVSTTEPPEMVSVSVGTDSPMVAAKDAARILSELLNQVVHVTGFVRSSQKYYYIHFMPRGGFNRTHASCQGFHPKNSKEH